MTVQVAYVLLHVIAVCGCKQTILELSIGSVSTCPKCQQRWRIKHVEHWPEIKDMPPMTTCEVELVSSIVLP
jgi:hypothetical protein